jgi:LPS sulfotransferase NodH
LTGTLKGSPGFAVNFLKSFDSLIYLEKRDKLHQAASIYVATMLVNNTNLEFDANKIGNCLKNVLIEHDGWQQIFKKAELTPTTIVSEDFQLKNAQVLKALAKAAGVDAKLFKADDVKSSSKLTDEVQQMRDKYAAFLGVGKTK